MLLDITHRLVDRLAGIASLWQMQEFVEAGVGREIEHPFGVVGSRIVHTGTAARGGCGLFQRHSPFGEASVNFSITCLFNDRLLPMS